MQIVIDIHKEIYDDIMSHNRERREGAKSAYYFEGLIQNGTPLPKGHGRLIDANKLDRIMYHKAFETDSDMQKWDSGCWIRYKMFENSMEEMPTIIEADKEIDRKETNNE